MSIAWIACAIIIYYSGVRLHKSMSHRCHNDKCGFTDAEWHVDVKEVSEELDGKMYKNGYYIFGNIIFDRLTTFTF